jgi:uncharacterized membrane protein HdeD (DUF308 family)/acetyl esterase/lipase
VAVAAPRAPTTPRADRYRRRMAVPQSTWRDRLPAWALVALGLACLLLGAFLTVDPLQSLRVLARLVGIGLVLSGVADLAGADEATRPWLSRVAGLIWIAGGVAALVWPGITIGALAIAAGIALVVGGALELAGATRDRGGEERILRSSSGTTSVLVGLIALTWPGITVLVIAVLFGVRTALFGVGLLVRAWRRRRRTHPAAPGRWPKPLRAIGAVAALVLAGGATVVSISVNRAQPGEPGAFYDLPSPLPEGEPGTIIRQEVVDGYVDGATTYRVLYLTEGFDGAPTAVSGMIFVPDGPAPAGGRPVVAYTHGTVGVTPKCAPSLQPYERNPISFEGGQALLDAGYVIAATDYQGMGTAGPNPYLVGRAQATDALDSVRAARLLPEAEASDRVVVWGYSQGGHAALFTGQLAPTYAPELDILGVAAGAPAPDLVDLFKVNVETPVGKVLISMAIDSWAQVYDTADLDDVLTPEAQLVVDRVADICLYGSKQILSGIPGALMLGFSFLKAPVWETEPWATIAAENTPGATENDAPLLFVLGTGDTVVAPEITERFFTDRCAEGAVAELLTVPDLGHIETSKEAAPEVVEWIVGRVEGEPAPDSCP